MEDDVKLEESPLDLWYKCTITEVTTDVAEKVTWYRVLVDSPDGLFETFQLEKRFSEFARLNAFLKKAFRAKALPSFPRKTLKKIVNPAFIQKRKGLLQTWLDTVLTQPVIKTCEETLTFFDLDECRGNADPATYKWKTKQFGCLVKKTSMMSLSTWLARDFICLRHYSNEVYAACYELKNRSLSKKKGEPLVRGHVVIWLQRRDSPSIDYLWKKDFSRRVTAITQDLATDCIYFALGNGRIVKLVYEKCLPTKDKEIDSAHEKEISGLLVFDCYLIAGSLDQHISFYDLTKDGECLGTHKVSPNKSTAILSLKIFGCSLFIGTNTNTVYEFDLKCLVSKRAIPIFSKNHISGIGSIAAMALHPDVSTLYHGGRENMIFESKRAVSKDQESVDFATWGAYNSLARNTKITAMTFCLNLNCICVGGNEGWIGVFDLVIKKWVYVFRPHTSEITALIYRSIKGILGGDIYTCSRDGSCRYFSLEPPAKYRNTEQEATVSKPARRKSSTLPRKASVLSDVKDDIEWAKVIAENEKKGRKRRTISSVAAFAGRFIPTIPSDLISSVKSYRKSPAQSVSADSSPKPSEAQIVSRKSQSIDGAANASKCESKEEFSSGAEDISVIKGMEDCLDSKAGEVVITESREEQRRKANSVFF